MGMAGVDVAVDVHGVRLIDTVREVEAIGVLGPARRRFLTRAWPYRTLPTKRGRPG
jgi:hypothetical protein